MQDFVLIQSLPDCQHNRIFCNLTVELMHERDGLREGASREPRLLSPALLH
jgi:hypothetical protein